MSLIGRNWTKIRALVGAHFVMAPLSFLWIYGNLSAYMVSYVEMSCSSNCNDGDIDLVLSIYVIFFCPGLLLTDPVVRKIGLKWTGLISMVGVTVAFLSAAWTLKISVIFTIAMLGALMGLVLGATCSISYLYVQMWSPEHASGLMASVSSASSLLAILQNQIITWIVNPQNLAANVRRGPNVYFSQPEILERVQTAMVAHGLMTFGLQAVGYSLVSIPPEPPTGGSSGTCTENDDKKAEISNDTEHKALADVSSLKYVLTAMDHSENCNGNGVQPAITAEERLKGKNGVIKAVSNGVNQQGKRCDTQATTPELTTINTESQQRSWKPFEMMQTAVFYPVWLSGVCQIYGVLIVNQQYKQFGSIYIKDDRFLTLIGTLAPIISAISRVVFGHWMDKNVFSIKTSIILSTSVQCILSSFFYFAPQVNKIVYMLFNIILGTAQNMYYLNMPTAAFRLFGPKYFPSNLGVFYVAASVAGVLMAVGVTSILQTWGWFAFFLTSYTLSLAALSLTVITKFP